MKKSTNYFLLALMLLFAACSSNNSKSTENLQLTENINQNISAYWECIEAYSSLNTTAPFVDFNLTGEQPVINGTTHLNWEIEGHKLNIEIANRSDASFSIVELNDDVLKIQSDISGVTYILSKRLMQASFTP